MSQVILVEIEHVVFLGGVGVNVVTFLDVVCTVVRCRRHTCGRRVVVLDAQFADVGDQAVPVVIDDLPQPLTHRLNHGAEAPCILVVFARDLNERGHALTWLNYRRHEQTRAVVVVQEG